MSTQVELVNMALDEIGEEPIAAMADTSDRALVAVRQWPRALAVFLREFHWPWAKELDTLTAASPVPAFGWAQRYALPADYVALVALNETTVQYPSDHFEIIGGFLHTDETEANIEYVHQPSGETALAAFLALMDPKAADAFVFLLAARMAPKLVKDGGALSDRLEQKYRLMVSAAKVIAANEQKISRREPAAESLFVQARQVDHAG